MDNSAIVFGVGADAGLGAALCRKFAAEGCQVFAVGRTPGRADGVVAGISARGGLAEAIIADASSEADVAHVFDRVSGATGATPALVVFNAGANWPVNVLNLPAGEFEAFWRAGCYAGFLVGREAVRRMLPASAGTIVFTGASASLRGRAGYAPFAAAKAGLRMVAQSLAREFGPKGLHVAHVIIDGGVDGQVLRDRFPQVLAERGEDGILQPDAVAQVYWDLHRQTASAWTQELDLRPFKETF